MGEIPLIPGISSRAGVVEEWMMVGCESVRPWQRIRCSAQIGWSCRYCSTHQHLEKTIYIYYIYYIYIHIYCIRWVNISNIHQRIQIRWVNI
jgi:hypothetical protein